MATEAATVTKQGDDARQRGEALAQQAIQEMSKKGLFEERIMGVCIVEGEPVTVASMFADAAEVLATNDDPVLAKTVSTMIRGVAAEMRRRQGPIPRWVSSLPARTRPTYLRSCRRVRPRSRTRGRRRTTTCRSRAPSHLPDGDEPPPPPDLTAPPLVGRLR
jgi:hypothetical protein